MSEPTDPAPKCDPPEPAASPKPASGAGDPPPGPIAAPGDGGPKPAPPPAAAIVLNGDRTERELQLEKDLETERQSRKKVELDNAQMQDELHRLKTTPPAEPKPRKKKRGPLGVSL